MMIHNSLHRKRKLINTTPFNSKTINPYCTWLEDDKSDKSEQKLVSTYRGYPFDETLFPVSLALQFSADISWVSWVLLLSPVHTAPMALIPRPLTYLTWGESWLKFDPQNWGRWVSLILPLSVDLESFRYQWPLLGICSYIQALLKKTCCYAVRHTDAVITHGICAVGAYSTLLWSIFGPSDSGRLSGASHVNSNDTLSLANVEDLICAQWTGYPPPHNPGSDSNRLWSLIRDTQCVVDPLSLTKQFGSVWSSLIEVSLIDLKKECLWLWISLECVGGRTTSEGHSRV